MSTSLHLEFYSPLTSTALASTRLSSILAGILLVQAARYWSTCQHDSRKLKVYVYGLVLAIVVLYLLDAMIMRSLLSHQLLASAAPDPLMILPSLLISSAVALATQCFFALRCYRAINGSRLFAFVTAFLLLSSFVFGFTGHIMRVMEILSRSSISNGRILATLGYCMIAATIIFITALQSIHLPPQEVGFNKSMDTVVSKVTKGSIITASAIAAAAIGQATLSIVSKELNHHFVIMLPLIEVSSVLYVLLQRDTLSKSLDSVPSTPSTPSLKKPPPVVIRGRTDSWDDPSFDLC